VDLSEFATAAGPPTAVQPIEDALAQTGLNLQDGDPFTHRVGGGSMRDASIREGDILLVRRQANARECDIRFPREHWPRIRHTNLIWVNRLEGALVGRAA